MKTLLRPALCAALVLTSLPSSSPAQTTDAATLLTQAIKNKQFVLQDYDGDSEIQYTLRDGKLVTPPFQLHAFSMFVPDQIHLKKNHLKIEGVSRVLVRDPATRTVGPAAAVRRVAISVDLGHADPETILPSLPALLFFSSLEKALAGLPLEVHLYLEHKVVDDTSFLPKDEQTVPPKILHQGVPEYSEEGARRKINGSCNFLLYINETGRVGNVWLIQPLGYGLDEKGAEAVESDKFQPAMKAGVPVEKAIFVSLSYSTF